jgi:hypothetical protein
MPRYLIAFPLGFQPEMPVAVKKVADTVELEFYLVIRPNKKREAYFIPLKCLADFLINKLDTIENKFVVARKAATG